MLSDIGEVTEAETVTGRKIPGPAERRLLKQAQQHYSNNSTPIRSSPTIGYEAVMKRAKIGSHQRKISIESTSTVKSEGQSAEIFKDFDDGVSVDDSVFQGDDEGSVADSYTEGVIASETQRLSKNANDQDRDQDGLSRRAEEILLNAKRRLNVRIFKNWSCFTNKFARTWKAILLAPEALCLSLQFIAVVLSIEQRLLHLDIAAEGQCSNSLFRSIDSYIHPMIHQHRAQAILVCTARIL